MDKITIPKCDTIRIDNISYPYDNGILTVPRDYNDIQIHNIINYLNYNQIPITKIIPGEYYGSNIEACIR